MSKKKIVPTDYNLIVLGMYALLQDLENGKAQNHAIESLKEDAVEMLEYCSKKIEDNYNKGW